MVSACQVLNICQVQNRVLKYLYFVIFVASIYFTLRTGSILRHTGDDTRKGW